MDELFSPFDGLKDHRASNARRHDLPELLAIAPCPFLGAGERCAGMPVLAAEKDPFLREFLGLSGGLPSHGTRERSASNALGSRGELSKGSRLFRRRGPEPFRAGFVTFMRRFAGTAKGLVAVAGKTPRHSFDTASQTSPPHWASAWSCEQRLALGQMAAYAKSNEITAIPKLRALLALKKTIVTIGAMGEAGQRLRLAKPSGGAIASQAIAEV